jgi:hypothetical protein
MLKRCTPLLALSLLLGACHKSNSGSGNSSQLAGHYLFLSGSGQVQTITLETGGGQTLKTVDSTTFKSANCTGTLIFAGDSATTKGLGYTATGSSTAYFYANNLLINSVSTPISETVPPTNSTTKYTVIGKDSIVFQGGNLELVGNSTLVAQPSGGRFSFKGDTLLIVEKGQQTFPPQSSGGVTTSSSASVVGTFVFLKQ